MALVWKDFPEINRSIGFSISYNTNGTTLGCHSGTISGVKAGWGTGYYSGAKERNLKVLDNTQGDEIKWKRDAYNDYYTPPKEEVDKIVAFLTALNAGIEEPSFLVDTYKQVIELCKNIPMWILSDAINYGSKSRTPIASDPYSRYSYVAVGSTGQFAKYLIDNSIGYVLQSPTIQNPSHKSLGTYSLNRAWIWIPPQHLNKALDTAEAFGDDKFPSHEDWSKAIAADLGLRDPAQAVEYAFNNGVFPPEKRFRRSKKMSPRVVADAVAKALPVHAATELPFIPPPPVDVVQQVADRIEHYEVIRQPLIREA
jgi:hypothetical protein